MPDLITLEQALRHLRLVVGDLPDPEDHPQAADVQFKLAQATGIVLDFVKDPDGSINNWTPDDCPGAVQAATAIVLSDLWENRAGSADDDVFLSFATRALLEKYRKPTLA
ncbi:head-tail connector protein [Devosia sp.]|uniref:head-tail connector protein n=1 Tax=Devosia sp. TaxID=1871048 RepID=UPI001B20851E|nr:head-tail connector protein [Devosia sp.]MBO9589070.1 phage gp6-like head-tail connector protein [Devosia sp.]